MADEQKFTPDGKQEIDPGNRRGNVSRRSQRLEFSDAQARFEENRGERSSAAGILDQKPQEVDYVPSAAEQAFAGPKPAPEVAAPTTNRARLEAAISRTNLGANTESLPVAERVARQTNVRKMLDVAAGKDAEEREAARMEDPKLAYANVRNTIRRDQANAAEMAARPRTTAFKQASARAANQLPGLEEDPWTAHERPLVSRESTPKPEMPNSGRHILEFGGEGRVGGPVLRYNSEIDEHGVEHATTGYIGFQQPHQDEQGDVKEPTPRALTSEDISRTGNQLAGLEDSPEATTHWATPPAPVKTPKQLKAEAAAGIERRQPGEVPFGSIAGNAHTVVDAGDRLHVVHYRDSERVGHSVLPAEGGTVRDEQLSKDNSTLKHLDVSYDGNGKETGRTETNWRVGRPVYSDSDAARAASADPSIRVSNPIRGTRYVLHSGDDTRALDAAGQADVDEGRQRYEAMKAAPLGKPEESFSAKTPIEVKSLEDLRSPRMLAIHSLWANAHHLTDKTRDARGKALPTVTPTTVFTVPESFDETTGDIRRSTHEFTGAGLSTALNLAQAQGVVRPGGVGATAKVTYAPTHSTQMMSDWWSDTLHEAQGQWRKLNGTIHESEYAGSKTEPKTMNAADYFASKNDGFYPTGDQLDLLNYNLRTGKDSIPDNPDYISREEHMDKVAKSGSDIALVKWHLDREKAKAQVKADLKKAAVGELLSGKFGYLRTPEQVAKDQEREAARVEAARQYNEEKRRKDEANKNKTIPQGWDY